MNGNNKPQPHYGYRRYMGSWSVYYYEPAGNGWTGTKVCTKQTREEARDEVYRLNGWKKKKVEI